MYERVSDDEMDRLERKMSEVMGMESGVFMTSGTMANLIGVMVSCRKKGSGVILGSRSHINNYEGGGVSAIANVMPIVIPNLDNG